MPFKVHVETSGGSRFEAHVADMKRRGRELSDSAVEVGFGLRPEDRGTPALAALLEFGDPRRRLPERPALRRAARTSGPVVEAWGDGVGRVPDEADLDALAGALEKHVVRSYERFEGAPNAERTVERKGHGRVFEGERGPRLISRISGKRRRLSEE